MATNEILPFAQGGGANVQNQVDYTSEPLRSSGNVAGIARSAVNNKALRQASVISAGTAQFLADNQATNITDSLTPTQIAAAFGQAIGTVSGVTSVTMTSTNVTLTDAQAIKSIIIISGTLTANLQLIFPDYAKQWVIVNNATGAFTITCKTASGSGAESRPGTVLSVIGDGTKIVSGLTASILSNGYQKLDSGLIIQWGRATVYPGQAAASVTFPVAFPSAVLCITFGDNAVDSANIQKQGAGSVTLAGFTLWTSNTNGDQPYWMAIGY